MFGLLLKNVVPFDFSTTDDDDRWCDDNVYLVFLGLRRFV
jgi:hypothetical protein